MLEGSRNQNENLSKLAFPHVPALDGIRAIAVGIVFIGHAKIFPTFPSGFGVTIFFFLSGFLITSLMRVENANTGKVDLRAFYIRRILRINPPLWISMIAMGLMVALGFLDVNLAWQDILSQALFFANYMPGYAQAGGLPSPLWSLAVEEHFYLVFPVIFIACSKKYDARKMAIGFALICFCMMTVRVFNVIAIGITEANYYWTHTRADSILFGSILALCSNPILDQNQHVWRVKFEHFIVAVLMTCASFFVKIDWFEFGIKYTIQGLTLFVIFLYILQSKVWFLRGLEFKIVQVIGLYSYTIYLIHYAFIISVRQNFPDAHILLQAAVSGALSLGFAFGMYALVERPLARLRKRMA